MGISNIFTLKGLIGVALDAGDMALSFVPVVGDVWDLFASGYCTLAWGGKPSIVSWIETLVPESESGPGAIIGLIPSCTIAAILAPDKPKPQKREYYGR